MGTLVSQTEIGVWVEAPETLLLGSAVSPTKKLRLYMKTHAI